ncbi:MAG: hypothetical protein WCE99_01525 [Nitrososphaeraceae archaeon]
MTEQLLPSPSPSPSMKTDPLAEVKRPEGYTLKPFVILWGICVFHYKHMTNS